MQSIRVSATLLAGSAALVLTVVSCGRGPTVAPALARDLVVITIDTLRADRVGVNGSRNGLTPALDALGRAGAVFLDATAHVPLTLPSHATIMTGRYPPSHGVHDNAGFALPASVPTLAAVLHDAGYHTAAFVSSFVLRASTGLARGFEVYDDRFEGIGRSHLTTSSLERSGPEVAREAAQWLAKAPRPFFLWVHFYDPHAPYAPPPAFAAKFPGQPYEAEIAASDFGVSTLLAALTPERRENTVIIATADHGESLGEHAELEHGILLYDATLHVPLIMRGPGVPAGIVVRQQVRHVDVLPTALALLGVKAPSPIDGVSLLRLFAVPPASTASKSRVEAVPAPPDPTLSYAESRFGELHFGWSPIRSARDGTWKYIDAPKPELYQLIGDPREQDNRHDVRADTAAALARALGGLVRQGDDASRASTGAGADAAERLRSLGYVSGRVALDSKAGPGGTGQAGQAGGEDPKDEISRYEQYVVGFNHALALLEDGRSREAETKFRALARDFPRAFEAHQYLARTLAARRSFPEAIAEFDLTMRLGPREPAVYFDAARALADAAQFNRAFDLVAEGRHLEPASFYGALTEGLIARAAGQAARAERAFAEAIRVNPDLAVAHLELGRLAEARGDRATARTEYRLALDGDSTIAEARQALVRVGPPGR
jgi:choline-sulfatase